MTGYKHDLIVQVETSLACEFFLSLYVFSERDNPWQPDDAGKAWVEAARNTLSPALLATIEPFCSQSQDMWRQLVALAYTCPPPRDIPTLLAYLTAIDPLELRLHLLGYYVRQHRRTASPSVISAAAQGDTAAQATLLTSFPEDERWQHTLRWLFSQHALEVKQRLLDMAHGWYDQVFRVQESQILLMLARDVEAKRALQANHTPAQLIEMCTGWEYVPEPGIRRIMLIPSSVLRPTHFEAECGDTRLFFYPTADESTSSDAATPPAHLLRLVKALGDERRLRILKMLARDSYTLQEAADALGVAKTTIHHHLVQLRAAGLVRMRMSDKRFSLRRYPLEHVGEWLSAYLDGPNQNE